MKALYGAFAAAMLLAGTSAGAEESCDLWFRISDHEEAPDSFRSSLSRCGDHLAVTAALGTHKVDIASDDLQKLEARIRSVVMQLKSQGSRAHCDHPVKLESVFLDQSLSFCDRPRPDGLRYLRDNATHVQSLEQRRKR